jgi:hypothetical protein
MWWGAVASCALAGAHAKSGTELSAAEADVWALPRPDNLSLLPRLPYEFVTHPVHDAVFSDTPLPRTRYVAVQGQARSNNRREALTLAAIAADALNRTLLVCDRPLVELYDVDALRSVVPVQVTYRCAAYHPRARGGLRHPRCTPSLLCNQLGWTFIDVSTSGQPRHLGGGVAVAIDRIMRNWGGRADRILTVDSWGVATWVYNARDATHARRLTEVASAVRYAPRLYEDARVLAAGLAAQQGLRAFNYHAAHLRTGDRVPHPLVDCDADFEGTGYEVNSCTKMNRGIRQPRQGECARKGRGHVTFADAAQFALDQGLLMRGDVFYIAAPDTSHPSVRDLQAVLMAAGVETTSLGKLVSWTNLRLPKTTPSCADGGRDKRPCLTGNFDYVSAIDQLLVAASRGGVHIADFPSTWDELTIELQCVAHDARLPNLANSALCTGHDFFHTPKDAAPHLPFSPRENKRLFFETVASYCGVF